MIPTATRPAASFMAAPSTDDYGTRALGPWRKPASDPGEVRQTAPVRRSIGERISVCLLTYNHAHLIASTLESIQRQTLSDYEIVVSDDCSTDGTWELVQQIASLDRRIRPVRTASNLGMPGNANFAVAHCHRPYIALLHHDDLYRSDLLEQWVGVLERNPDAAFAFNPYRDLGFTQFPARARHRDCIDGRWLLRAYLFRYWGSVIRGTAMIRRCAWDEVGGMQERYGLIADVDLWMRLAARWPAGYCPEYLIDVRQARPPDYPMEYQEEMAWSWSRRRLLYEIHANNRQACRGTCAWSERWKWLVFRAKVSADILTWLGYAVVRRKLDMIASSGDAANPYELGLVKLIRRALTKAYETKIRVGPAAR